MITWEKYCSDCKKFKIENPYKTEADFNRAYGIDQFKEPLIITPKNQKRPMKASFENSIKDMKPKKPKAVKPPRVKLSDEEKKQRAKEAAEAKEKKRLANIAMGLTGKGKPRKIALRNVMSEEEKRERRLQQQRARRAANIAKGLTCDGRPKGSQDNRKNLPTEVKRERWTRYAKTYREKNREKHLAYRKEYREKNMEKLLAKKREYLKQKAEKLLKNGCVNSLNEPTNKVA